MKDKSKPPEVVLEYQYPSNSSLKVRIVKTTSEHGEVDFHYEQSEKRDRMNQPIWKSAEEGGDKPETCLGRVVALLGGVLTGTIKA